MNRTKIEYADYTWNLWTGCYHNCPYCYARRIAQRFKGKGGRQCVSAAAYSVPGQPIYWAKPGSPPFPMGFAPTYYESRRQDPCLLRGDRHQRIFVNDMSDTFGDWVPHKWLVQLFAMIAFNCEPTFLVLTKNPARARDLLSNPAFVVEVRKNLLSMWHGLWPEDEAMPWPLPNVWLGTSIEDQAAANERVPLIRQAPAALHWLSVEPMLGRMDLGRATPCGYYCDDRVGHVDHQFWTPGIGGGIGWVVAGAQTGPRAQPADLAWFRELRDQCKLAGVPFFMKKVSGGGPIPPDLMIREYPR